MASTSSGRGEEQEVRRRRRRGGGGGEMVLSLCTSPGAENKMTCPICDKVGWFNHLVLL